jgi:hypothetical protein
MSKFWFWAVISLYFSMAGGILMSLAEEPNPTPIQIVVTPQPSEDLAVVELVNNVYYLVDELSTALKSAKRTAETEVYKTVEKIDSLDFDFDFDVDLDEWF